METATVTTYPDEAYERIYAPVLDGLDAEICIVGVPDGWQAGARARLPEADYEVLPTPATTPHATRNAAIVDACEALIAWTSEEKDHGGKKHQERAQQLQDWALGLPKSLPETVAAPANSQVTDLPVQMVPLRDLYESPQNPRQQYPEATMAQLVESMRANGFRPWLPLLVRPRAEGGYEIAAGHRRRRAAEMAGIEMVPCIIRDMTEEQFLDVLNFDNSGREDVHPLHEAAGWRAWMDKTGKGVIDIAQRIGQSKEYVYQRLKYAALCDKAREAFLNNEVTAGHAILIARLPKKEQQKALTYCVAQDWQGRRPSVRALADFLRQNAYVDLRDCPFDSTDAALVPAAGACGDCPKRAGNIPGFEFDPNEPEADPCTDRACYQRKLDAHLAHRKKALEAKGKPVVLVSSDWGTSRKKGVLGREDYEKVKPGEPGAVEALCVVGSQVGQVITVLPKRTADQPWRSAAEEKAAQERAAQEREARDERELNIRCAILRAVTEKVGGLKRPEVEALIGLAIGGHVGDGFPALCRLHGISYEAEWEAGGKFADALPAMSNVEIKRAAVEISVISDFDTYRLDDEPEALLALARRYEVDADKIRREMEDAAKAAAAAKKAAAKKAAGKKSK